MQFSHTGCTFHNKPIENSTSKILGFQFLLFNSIFSPHFTTTCHFIFSVKDCWLLPPEKVIGNWNLDWTGQHWIEKYWRVWIWVVVSIQHVISLETKMFIDNFHAFLLLSNMDQEKYVVSHGVQQFKGEKVE